MSTPLELTPFWMYRRKIFLRIEPRWYSTPADRRPSRSSVVFGDKATLRIDRASFEIIPEGKREPSFVMKSEGMDQHHKKNFVRALQSRRKPAADEVVGHLAAIPGHLANISYHVGRQIRWDAAKETIPGDAEARALLGRTYRAPYVL